MDSGDGTTIIASESFKASPIFSGQLSPGYTSRSRSQTSYPALDSLAARSWANSLDIKIPRNASASGQPTDILTCTDIPSQKSLTCSAEANKLSPSEDGDRRRTRYEGIAGGTHGTSYF